MDCSNRDGLIDYRDRGVYPSTGQGSYRLDLWVAALISEDEVALLLVVTGVEGIDWHEYVTCPEYWQLWAWLNRN